MIKIKINIKKRTLLIGALCLIWLLVIFLFSAMNATKSTSLTEVALSLVYYIRENNSFVDQLLIRLTQNHSIFYIIRKIAHMFVFCILQIIAFCLFKTSGKSSLKSALYSMIFVVVYACTDEFHQLFVSGRSGQITDVIIDSIGGLIGLVAISTIIGIKKIFIKLVLKGEKNGN